MNLTMKLCVLAMLLGALSVALPCAANQVTGARSQAALAHVSQAKKYLTENEPSLARTELEAAIRIDPNYGEAYYLLGQLDLQGGDIAQAISAFEQALKLDPNSFNSHYGLAMAFLRNHDVRSGTRELKAALNLRPHDVDANYNLGVLLLDEGRPAEAIEHLRLSRTPGHERPDVAYNLIRSELEANQPVEAKKEANQSADSLASDANWQAAVGQMFLEHNIPDAAIQYLSRALALRPDSIEIQRPLAAAYLESSMPGRAVGLIKNPKSGEDYYLLASANYMLQKYTAATSNATTAVHMEPGKPQYLLLAARVDQHLGLHDAALRLLQNAIKLEPKWADLYYSAGVSLYCEKRYVDAQKYLTESLSLQPDSARTLFLYAVSLVSEGNDQEGESYLRRAVELNPRNAHFQYYLGEVLMRQNRLSDAERVYRRAIAIDPQYAAVHYQLGKIMLRTNQPGLAAQQTEKAISYDPSLAEAYYQLIQAYNKLGEREKSARAAVIFAKLKKENISDKEKFYESVKKELGLP